MNDITERKQVEEALRVSHHFLEIANRHTQTIPLLKEFVAEVRKFTGCAAVGIRLLDTEGNIPYQAYEGFSQRFYESESPLSIRSDQCMCITVIKGETDSKRPFYTENGSFYMNNTTRFLATVSEEEKGQTRNVCNQVGYESVALIPISMGQRILGLIHVADPRENQVPLEKVKVLEDVGIQLGMAIKRIETEEKLVQTNQMLNSITQGITDGIFLLSMDRKILWANEAILRTSGLKMEEVVGNTCYKVTHKEENPCQSPVHVCPIEGVLQGRSPVSVTHTHFNAEGNPFVVEVSAYPVKDKNEEIVQFVHLSKDITQRKRMEERLRETKNYLENLIDYANAPIIVWDPMFKITRFNHAFEHLTGYTADEVMGQELHLLFPKAGKDESLGKIRSTLSGERWESVEIPILRKDGEIRIALWNSANIYAEDGRTHLATIAQGQDITERKQGEEAIKESEMKYRQQAARAEALARTATRLNTLLDLEKVLMAVCEETAQALNVPTASVRLYDEERQVFYPAAGYGLPPDFDARSVPYPKTIYDEYFKEGRSFTVIQDVQAVSGLPNAELYSSLNIRTIVGAILLRGTQIIGGLNIATIDQVRYFTEDELKLLEGLAAQATQAITNANLFKQTEKRLQQIECLRTIDMAITASLDVRVTLNIIMDQATSQLGIDAGDILLFDPHTQTLEYTIGRGFRTAALQHTRLRLGEGHAGLAAVERRIVTIPNLLENPGDLVRAPLITKEGFVTYCVAPLIAKGQIKGVIEFFNRSPLHFIQEWFDFLEAVSGQAAIAIDNVALFDDLQRSNIGLMLAYDTTLEGWSRALDLRDKETEGHTQRVTEITLRLGKVMDIDNAELVHVRRGALLHDIGKMGIPDHILLKPGPLTEEEWEIMRKHPVYAYKMLSPITYLRPALLIPYGHHEKWDGTGYPRGLKGEQLPLSARVFAVADVWDALTSDRPYRPAWPEEKAREYIRQQAGKHFDPEVVAAFLKMEL